MSQNIDFIKNTYELEVYCPTRFIHIEKVGVLEYKLSIWEKKRDEIILRLKKRKRIFNLVAKYFLFALSIIISASFFLLLVAWIQTQAMAYSVGITMPMCWILFHTLLTEKFPVNISDIRYVKHKGKKYY